jgi:hypothetical protein
MRDLSRRTVLRKLDTLFGVEAPVDRVVGLEVQGARDSLHALLRETDIAGYGFAQRQEGKKTENAITVYTRSEGDEATLMSRSPDSFLLPGTNHRLPFQVVNIGSLRPQGPEGRNRPFRPGHSISHCDMAAGTLSLIVKKRGIDFPRYVLGANHVLTQYGALGDQDDIIQPGLSDGGRHPADRVARLAERVEIKFHDSEYQNKVDAAIGELITQEYSTDIEGIGQIAGVGRSVRRDMRVKIYGKRSREQFGKVNDPTARLRIPYKVSLSSYKRAGFRDMVVCTRFSSPGDSGAAVLSENNQVLGLIVAGSDVSSVFCKIGNVFHALDIELV